MNKEITTLFSKWFFKTQKQSIFRGDLSQAIEDLSAEFVQWNNETQTKKIGNHIFKKCEYKIHVASCINGLNSDKARRYESAYRSLKSTIENAHGILQMNIVK